MTLQDIKDKIISDANSDVKKIKKETEEKIDNLKKDYQKETEEKKSNILSNAKEKAKLNLKGALIEQKIKNSNEILSKKREIIDSVLAKTLSKLNESNSEDYKKLIQKQLNKIKDINFNSITILCPQSKQDLIKETIKDKIKANNISFNASKEVNGGFKIKTEDSLIDLSFENLISENKQILESEINKIAFKG